MLAAIVGGSALAVMEPLPTTRPRRPVGDHGIRWPGNNHQQHAAVDAADRVRITDLDRDLLRETLSATIAVVSDRHSTHVAR